MNVILADDESLVRSSLRSMLEEMDIPIRIVGEARNGEELLGLIRTTSPDLIFVDIRMPRMDGLEAIRQGKPFAPEANWVIVTGFSEFKYAHDAIRLGAIDYLLKPADPDELEKCVRHAIEERNSAAYYLNCEFESWIGAALRRTDRLPCATADSAYHGYILACFALYSDISDTRADSPDRLQPIANDIRQAVLLHPQGNDVRGGIVSLRDGTLTCCWAIPRADKNRDPSVLEFIERQTMTVVRRAADSGVYVLRTNGCDDLPALQKEAEELQALAHLRIYHSPAGTQAVTLESLRAEAEKPNVLSIAEHLVQLNELYARKDYMGYSRKLVSLRKLNPSELFENRGWLTRVCGYLSSAMEAAVNADMPPEQWFHSLQLHGDAMLQATNAAACTDRTDLVQRIIDYIEEHYMDEIAIGTLAGAMNVTPNYLSTLFHKRMGITFVKYLTGTRMLKAKELLMTKPEMKVQDIAQAVGYFSSRHFTKLFLEQFKCYPSEIREQNA
ncbi:response regulator [Cohnella sp. AR92]|uniref:response regulator transcription factor n=1 Tax=Cohnella sp. AR92 TaxID=648716 RepID=UPI000F8ECB5E|nr:response regulator [Cohnella sp. AR92]RUS49129.1 response regulator [Cohnella sp. AR92]